MKNTTLIYKNIVVPIILKHLPDVRILLYGSRARGDEGAGSDIDIALDMGTPIDEKVMTKIYFDLEECVLPIKFDLVDFHTVSKQMQEDIQKEGVEWKK